MINSAFISSKGNRRFPWHQLVNKQFISSLLSSRTSSQCVHMLSWSWPHFSTFTNQQDNPLENTPRNDCCLILKQMPEQTWAPCLPSFLAAPNKVDGHIEIRREVAFRSADTTWALSTNRIGVLSESRSVTAVKWARLRIAIGGSLQCGYN